MSIAELSIIGERINPGFRSSKDLFDREDLKGIQALAKNQVEKGAACLNINVGERALKDPQFMAEVIRSVQAVVSVPLSFDFPNVEVQEVCLKTYDIAKAGGIKPIVNSISELRWEMLELLTICPFRILLMASERMEDGARVANKTASEVQDTTTRMVKHILNAGHEVTLDDLFVDVSVGPVGADMDGLTQMGVDAIKAIGGDQSLAGIHMSVGLSNISIMLPKKATDGSPLKSQIESAFLTLTVPHGLDTIIGTAGRNYQMLPDDNIILQGLKEALAIGGIESVMRIQKMYQAS